MNKMRMKIFKFIDKLKTWQIISIWILAGFLFAFIYIFSPEKLSFLDSVYFSFVTLLTLGYGDIVVTGFARTFAIAETFIGLIIYGIVIFKMMSIKQDMILSELHKLSIQDYVSRLRHYLFVSRANLSRFLNNFKSKKIFGKQEMFELEILSTTLEANIHDAHDLICRSSSLIHPIAAEDLEILIQGINVNLENFIEIFSLIPKETKIDGKIIDNTKKIISYNDNVCEFFRKKSEHLGELTKLNEKLKNELKKWEK